LIVEKYHTGEYKSSVYNSGYYVSSKSNSEEKIMYNLFTLLHYF